MEPENQEQEIEMNQEPLIINTQGGAVNSVNGKTGDVVLTTSDLENDSDYQTGSEVESAISSAIGEINIPTKTSDLENDGEDGESVYIEADELAAVATSGSYNDLDNKPTIPAAQVNSDWNANSGVAQILNKPTIPTVNDATLTITQNGTSKGTFTANDADDTTIEVSDTTYSNFTGTDGVSAGTSGLVPAPATTDAGKFLKADGTWDTAGGSGPTVVQTTGTSTTDVMSQKASSEILYGANASTGRITLLNYSPDERVSPSSGQYNRVGSHSVLLSTDWTYAAGDKNVIIGGSNGGQLGPTSANTSLTNSIALGYNATNNYNGGVALGAYSQTNSVGEMNIGSSNTSFGYNNTNYRLISGVHDPVNAHDAATKGYVDGKVLSDAGAPTTSTTGTVGQLYEDTTNGKLYQCTAVSGGAYTWTEVGAGGGGGGDTVYSDKSTSDNSLGGAVYIGNLNSNQEEQPDPTTNNYHFKYFWALPNSNTNIPNDKTINILGTNAAGNWAVAIGNESNVTTGSDYGVAIGYTAAIRAYGGVAIGGGASIASGLRNSIALGTRSNPTRSGELNVGNTWGAGFNNTNYRVIGGVHDGQDAHDCATVGQINATIDAINTALSTNIPHIGA